MKNCFAGFPQHICLCAIPVFVAPGAINHDAALDFSTQRGLGED